MNGAWKTVLDAAGTAAVFNGVSGNPTTGGCDNGAGGALDGNYFDTDVLNGGSAFYGNSTWYVDVTFPLPAQSGDTKVRWRVLSDAAWSDADGRGDTDGLGAVDNVSVSFIADGAMVTDDFETGDLAGVSASAGSAAWVPGNLLGNTYDGWHLQLDPMYSGKGATCAFDESWMWAAKPNTGAIPSSANGFDFFLVSPAIDVSGWSSGFVRWSGYSCEPIFRNPANQDLPRINVRTYDTALGWTPWTDVTGIGFGTRKVTVLR